MPRSKPPRDSAIDALNEWRRPAKDSDLDSVNRRYRDRLERWTFVRGHARWR